MGGRWAQKALLASGHRRVCAFNDCGKHAGVRSVRLLDPATFDEVLDILFEVANVLEAELYPGQRPR